MRRFNRQEAPPNEGQTMQFEHQSCMVSLVNLASGVAAGRTRHHGCNAQLEWWTLFSTQEQYEACAQTDPLRFSEPLGFARLTREFNNAFDQTRPAEVDSAKSAGR